jgi:hypothetical protein
MRRSYVVPMRWMVIYEYEVPGRALNLSSTKLPRPWSPWESFPSRKNPHDRTGNRIRGLKIDSQKLWPLDHQAGHVLKSIGSKFVLVFTSRYLLDSFENIWIYSKHPLLKTINDTYMSFPFFEEEDKMSGLFRLYRNLLIYCTLSFCFLDIN